MRGGKREREGESAMSALHQKLCQSLTTTNISPPLLPYAPCYTLSSTHILISLLLTASQGCPRLNVNPLFRVTRD